MDSTAKSAPGDHVRPYLSIEQVAELTPWTKDAIEKMIRRGVFKRGIHYFQPMGRRTRLLFKWAAIVELIEGRASRGDTRSLVEGVGAPDGREAAVRRVIDVEKATTELQQLLA